MKSIIISHPHFDPLSDGVNEDHLARVRKAKKERGIPVHLNEHPFRKHQKSPATNYERIIFGAPASSHASEIL